MNQKYFNRKNPQLYKNIIDEVEKIAYNHGEKMEDFIKKNISRYAKSVNNNMAYSELISELYSMANGEEQELALDLFRKVAVLNED